ncbi:MAG: hypothetical protein ACREYF_22755 [Gammaproteobacteria bacterium]
MRFKRYTLGIIFGMAISAAMAAALEEGQGYYANKDYSQAWRVLKPMAESGNAQAQLLVADMYRQGLGVTPADQEAIRWYRKAAENGVPEAQHAVAGAYFEGKTLPHSLEQAIVWWSRAAGAGLVAAQYDLGLMYARGLGAGRDDRGARGWFEKAASQGHTAAQFALGVMYAYGQGVECDVDQARQWFEQAAKQGMPEAQYNVAALTKAKQERPVDPDGVQEWRRQPTEPGLTAAHETLASIRAQSAGNRIKAESWILAREPSHFTVQLATITDQDTVIPFIESQTLDQELAYFRVRAEHRTHYVIICGDFGTVQDARTALAHLPAQLLQAKPLVRSFQQVREMIGPSGEGAGWR